MDKAKDHSPASLTFESLVEQTVHLNDLLGIILRCNGLGNHKAIMDHTSSTPSTMTMAFFCFVFCLFCARFVLESALEFLL